MVAAKRYACQRVIACGRCPKLKKFCQHTHLAVVVPGCQGFLNVIAGVQLWVCQQPLQADTPLYELVAEVLCWVVQLPAECGIPVVLDGIVCPALEELGQSSPLVGVDLLRLRGEQTGRQADRQAGRQADSGCCF